MNKQSNLYTVIYIVVLVAVVGAALAFTSMSLRDRQTANINADKMRQILASLNITVDKSEIIPTFENVITEQLIVDNTGNILEGNAFDINVASEVKKPADERRLPVYIASTEQGKAYILPVYGAGLWGPIWGYIALKDDASTVYGAYFSHQGETPGLGAEIEKPKFSNQFQGKHLFKGEELRPIAVVKNGQKPSGDEDYVDGVSGGTITSKGVGAMIDDCLTPYANYLKTIRSK